MRAFPFQRLGRALRVREPERDAVVMRDGEANTLRGERQSADGRWHLEHALGTLAAARKRLLARRPRDGAVRADRHMVDPAALAVGGHHGAVACCVGRHHLAVVAAGHDAAGVRGRAQDGAAVHRRRAHVARFRNEQQCLLAQHEHRGLAEKMRGHDRRARLGAAACAPRRKGYRSWCRSRLSQPEQVRLHGRVRPRGRRHGCTGFRCDHARQPSNPCRILSSGSLRPMKTRRLSRFSPAFHGRW